MARTDKVAAIGMGILTVGAVAVLASFGSWYRVDQGERGIELTFGEVSSISEPGLHFKIPFVNSVKFVDVRTQTQTIKTASYSADQQPAEITYSVTFAVNEGQVDKLYSEFNTIENFIQRILVPNTVKELKIVFGQFTAIKSVQMREDFNNRVYSAIEKDLMKYPFISLKSIQIENVDFSDAYEQTIEDRMKAEVEVERFKQNLEREKVEAEIVLTKAQAIADSQVKQAEAEAKAITLKSEAEAQSIQKKGDALRKNPEIINLINSEKWDGKLPHTMIPSSAVPMVNIQSQ